MLDPSFINVGIEVIESVLRQEGLYMILGKKILYYIDNKIQLDVKKYS